MEEKRKSKRIKVNAGWVVTFKFQGSSDFTVEQFGAKFTITSLMAALFRRGITLPLGSGIRFINMNTLLDKRLYLKYPDLTMTKEDQEIIARINSVNEHELKRFNRSLIERGDPHRTPKSPTPVLLGGLRIKDVSESGLCILSKTPIAVDSILELEIHSEELVELLRVWVKIVRTGNSDDEKYKFELGLVFLELPYAYWKRIHDFIGKQ